MIETNQAMLVDSRTAARLLSISPRKLWALTANGEINSVKIGRSVRYDPADLRQFIDAQKEELRQKLAR